MPWKIFSRRSDTRRTEVPPAIVQQPSSTIGDAPITITLSQFDELRSKLHAAETAAADAKVSLAAALARDPAGEVPTLRDLARALLTIVRFAIENLPPMEIPKWPWHAVGEVARLLPKLPDFSHDDEVLVSELHLLVREIQQHELLRTRKREARIAGVIEEKDLRP